MADNLVFAGFCAAPLVALFGLSLFFAKFRRGKGGKGSWGKLLLGNLLVLLFLGSLALLSGEIYFRFFYDTTDAFTLTKTSRRWFERHYHLKSVAVRDDHDYFPRIQPPHTHRITFIGDSFTAGHGIPRIEDRFADRIRRQHPEWKCTSWQDSGPTPGEELEYLKQLAAAGYQFDQVVLVYCLNDIDDVVPAWSERYRKINQRLRRRQPAFFFNTASS